MIVYHTYGDSRPESRCEFFSLTLVSASRFIVQYKWVLRKCVSDFWRILKQYRWFTRVETPRIWPWLIIHSWCIDRLRIILLCFSNITCNRQLQCHSHPKGDSQHPYCPNFNKPLLGHRWDPGTCFIPCTWAGPSGVWNPRNQMSKMIPRWT